jgi:hypothetical protein
VCLLVGVRSFWIDQEKRVIELNVGISELESLIGVARLAVGGAEEVTCSGTFDDGLR